MYILQSLRYAFPTYTSSHPNEFSPKKKKGKYLYTRGDIASNGGISKSDHRSYLDKLAGCPEKLQRPQAPPLERKQRKKEVPAPPGKVERLLDNHTRSCSCNLVLDDCA